jgi:hypothetical protein
MLQTAFLSGFHFRKKNEKGKYDKMAKKDDIAIKQRISTSQYKIVHMCSLSFWTSHRKQNKKGKYAEMTTGRCYQTYINKHIL